MPYRSRTQAIVLGSELGYCRWVCKARLVAIVLDRSCRRRRFMEVRRVGNWWALTAIPELPRGVKGAALKAWDEKVGFLETFGVKDGDSTLKAFLDLLTESAGFSLCMRCA